MTQELEDKVANLERTVHELEVLLLGNAELKKQAEHDRKYGIQPMTKEPPPGALEAIADRLDALQKADRDLSDFIKQVEVFGKKLEAFFGPMLHGKTPPLNDHAIADKKFVTDAITTFAGAIRDEMKRATELSAPLAKALYTAFPLTERERHQARSTVPENGQEKYEPLSLASFLAAKLQLVYQRELARIQKEEADAKRPGRLQSLVYAVTGRAPMNGTRP